MGGVGAASAKLILFGEHAAVYGHPALGMSLPECTTVRVSGGTIDEWDLSHVPSSDRETVRRLLDRLEELLPRRVRRGTVRIASNVPRGVGFGSSAALCGALARALVSRLPRRDPGGPDQAWRLAHETERIFHGTPSGIDTGLSLGQGMHVLEPHPPDLPDRKRVFPATVWMVVSAVPRDAACGDLIASLAVRMRSGDPATRGHLDQLGRLAIAARDALIRHGVGAAPRVGELAELAMGLLRALGLGNPDQDRLLSAGRQAGALGGKLSGAGGGGAFFMVAPDRRTALAIAECIRTEARQRGIELAASPRIVRT